MTVGREISPECSTDERREWQKGAAALAISSRRPTGSLGSRMIRSIICERQLAGCGCFLPYLLVCTAGCSLGAASARPFSPVSVHRAIARLIENRGPCVPYPVHLYHNTVQHQRFSAARFVLREPACFFCPRARFIIPKILVDFFAPTPSNNFHRVHYMLT